jgi:hypothetical protein
MQQDESGMRRIALISRKSNDLVAGRSIKYKKEFTEPFV